MAFIAPLLGSLGAGAGAAGISSFLGVAGSVVGLGATLAQTSYQNKVAAMAAQTAQKNANRSITEGQKSQKDQDEAAALQLAEVTAGQAASGFSLASPTFSRINARNRMLARRDASRIREGSIDTAQNFMTQKAEAESQKQGMFMPLLTGALDIGKSWISGANLVRNSGSRYQNNSTRQIRT